MYHEDLTEYRDGYDHKILSFGFDPESAVVLNIGWLEGGHSFPTCEVRSELLAGILYLIGGMRFNVTRGWHLCSLCQDYDAGSRYVVVNGKETGCGDAEVWVPGIGKVWYAAPTLIYHYVKVHNYCPPLEFQDAVISFHQSRGNTSDDVASF